MCLPGKYLSEQEFDALIGKANEVGRLINGLLRSLAYRSTKTDESPDPLTSNN